MAGIASERGETLSRWQRLRRRQDFLRCYRRGKKRRGSLATLHFFRTPARSSDGLGDVRLGITASRKVGKAVIRGQLKRRIREIFRRYRRRRDVAALDLVVHLWPQSAKADFAALRDDIEGLLATLPREPRVKTREGEKK